MGSFALRFTVPILWTTFYRHLIFFCSLFLRAWREEKTVHCLVWFVWATATIDLCINSNLTDECVRMAWDELCYSWSYMSYIALILALSVSVALCLCLSVSLPLFHSFWRTLWPLSWERPSSIQAHASDQRRTKAAAMKKKLQCEKKVHRNDIVKLGYKIIVVQSVGANCPYM